MALLIVIPVLLGIGIVVALAISKQSDPQVVLPVTPTLPLTETAADAGTAPTNPALDPLKPLTTTQTPQVPTTTTTGVRPVPADGGAVAQAPDAAPMNPFNFTLPSFDGGLPVITIPSGFTFPTGFPGMPPPPTN